MHHVAVWVSGELQYRIHIAHLVINAYYLSEVALVITAVERFVEHFTADIVLVSEVLHQSVLAILSKNLLFNLLQGLVSQSLTLVSPTFL